MAISGAKSFVYLPCYTMDNTSYIVNKTDNTAEIFLYGEIGGEINAGNFVSELRFLDSLELDTINIRINSQGGSVIDGFGIYSAIKGAKTPIDTYADGIAASIAGVIFQAGRKRFISDFARFMIHDPHFGRPTAQLTNKQKEVLSSIKDALLTLMDNENNVLTAEQINSEMSAETWHSGEEAVSAGWADEVLTIKREAAANYETLEEIYNLTNLKIKPNTNNMEGIINHFGLDAEASQDDVLNAVKDLEAKNETLTSEKETLTSEKETLTNEVADLKDAATEATEKAEESAAQIENLNKELAAAIVEAGIKDGKLNADNKEALINQASENLEGFKAILNAVPKAQKVVNITDLIDSKNNTEDPNNRANWTLRDWEKNDPKALLKMMKSEPEAYNKLYNTFYKIED